jgi:hypothetical protein
VEGPQHLPSGAQPYISVPGVTYHSIRQDPSPRPLLLGWPPDHITHKNTASAILLPLKSRWNILGGAIGNVFYLSQPVQQRGAEAELGRPPAWATEPSQF